MLNSQALSDRIPRKTAPSLEPQKWRSSRRPDRESPRIVMQPASMVKFSKLRDLNSKNWGLVVRNRTFRRFSKRKWSLNQKTMVLPPAKHLAYCTENKPATNHVGSFRSYHKSLQSIMSCAMMWFHVHFEPKSIVRRFQNSARFSF